MLVLACTLAVDFHKPDAYICVNDALGMHNPAQLDLTWHSTNTKQAIAAGPYDVLRAANQTPETARYNVPTAAACGGFSKCQSTRTVDGMQFAPMMSSP